MEISSWVIPSVAAAMLPLAACSGTASSTGGDEVSAAGEHAESGADTEIQVYVLMVSGKTIELQVRTSHTIQQVKMEIHKKEGVPVEQQCLVFQQQKLKSSCTLYEYNVQNESSLNLICVMPIQVFVKSLKGQKIKLVSLPEDTVLDLKMALQEETSVPPDQMLLIAAGQRLEDGRTLQDHGIEDKTVLHMVLRLHSCGQFFVETEDGLTFRIDGACADRSVEDVKVSVYDKTGILPADQELRLGRQVLEDNRNLGYYGIKKESKVYLARRRHELQQQDCCWCCRRMHWL
eukprot:TRINITY_DN32323_c0_g1_i1.p1 TRINITY_DN32323_c0_g1~~TRINITY_DN32323_c0_g1_i1.p1  ORF type:complete len:307 (+),score=78.10 TRINITY_DN32323_c0_g1_i1:52-921(+)